MSQAETTGLEIAIVGMAGRFPGARTVEELWAALLASAEGLASFSDDELREAGVAAETLADPNFVRAGGAIDDVDRFDAAFFGYSPREAALMDPQQRVFLETAWTALEHAGYAPGTFDGAIGVYGGIGLNEYFLNHVQPAQAEASIEMTHLANKKDFLATRVSYKLNLTGPSLVVQTACSTSLVAIHLACQALLAGECDMALAGGVTIRLPQKRGYLFQEGGISSPDGHCRAFSGRARGCIAGNGGGIVVLRRLAEARADRDCIHAVIKGSAINNDGSVKVGYTAPAVDGQARVIRSALRAADVSAGTIGYLEAHGTGTVLGDPIEIQAATEAFRQDTARTGYCALGSIKSNIGHLDAGAGVASVIKAALAVKHGVVPATLHCDPPNPQIDFAASPFFLNAARREWTAESGVRRAGVSSFGIGGTNAHLVLEEPPPRPPAPERRPHDLLLLSGKTERALEESAAALAVHLREHRDVDLGDVAFTLRCGRAGFAYRRALVCRDVDDAIASLEAHGGPGPKVGGARPIFMFPGQGAQYPGMGRELYDAHRIFRDHVDAAADLAAPWLGFDLRNIIAGAVGEEMAERLRDTRVAQPAIFTMSYALARLIESWGVKPAAMIGHSVGEYVAACVADVISFGDALWLVCERGRLMGGVAPGAMCAVALDARELDPMLRPPLALAAANAPDMAVVSGPVDAVAALTRELQERGVDVRPLHTSHAFHSPMMDPVLDAFTTCVKRVRLQAPRIPYVSNVTGTWITADDATNPDYWARHLRGTVHFSEGLQATLDEPGAVLLEVGPGATLVSLARRHRRDGASAPIAFATTRRPYDPPDGDKPLLEAIGGAWTAGVEVDWRRVELARGARRMPLPTYPFQRERCWLEAPARPAAPSSGLGRRADLAEWFSVPGWQRVQDGIASRRPAADDMLDGVAKVWLVFADSHGLGEEIADRLKGAGREVVIAMDGPRFERVTERLYRIDPSAPDDYQRLCADLHGIADRGNPGDRLEIVHCWMAEPDAVVRRGREHLDRYETRGFYSLLFLAQALGAQTWITSCRVTAVTSNVYDVTGSEVLCPEKATAAGVCKVFPLEYPGFLCRHVDVTLPERATTARAVLLDRLLETLERSSGDVIAIRGRSRWRPTLDPVPLGAAGVSAILKQGGVYLITGGFGGLGLTLAQHLWKTVRARLVLVGRTALPPPSQQHALASVDADAAIAHLARTEEVIAGRVVTTPMGAIPGLEPLFDRLAAAHVLAFFRRAGIDPHRAQAAGRDELAARCRVLPKFERLFDRMLCVLREDGYVVLEGANVRFTGRPQDSSLEGLRQRARAEHPQMAPVFDLLDGCASNLHRAISGDMPALELLFGEDSADRFKRAVEVVRRHSSIPLCQELVRELLSTATASAAGRPLRVLEVGGGEGLLTEALLPVFAGQGVEYHFTDVGTAFVRDARRRAAKQGLDFMRFATLDISKPATGQGFGPSTFDVVVAFNVVHATPRIAETLAHIRELIAPGGLLVLQESIRPSRWVDLVWGLTDGWWAFDDVALREESGPLLALGGWSRALAGAGYELVTSFPAGSGVRSTLDTALIVARRPLPASGAEVDAAAPRDRAIGDRAAAVAALERQGAEIEAVAADVSDPVSMRAAVERALQRFGRIDGVVHAALVLNDGAMQVKTRAGAEAVLAPKVAGTLVLKEICEGLNLDLFVMFSSLVSLLGGSGQVDYCAASAFQDAFAHAEQGALARRVVSIDWASWREVGKAFRVAVERGATPEAALPDGMSPADGLEAFTRVLGSPFCQVAVSPQDPVNLMKSAAASEVPSEPAPVAPASSPAAWTDTQSLIAGIWQEVLGLARVDVNDNFFDLGGDSMISLQFIAKAKQAGLRFTNQQVFEHQTIAELAAVAGAAGQSDSGQTSDMCASTGTGQKG